MEECLQLSTREGVEGCLLTAAFYSAVALTLFFRMSRSGACGPRFVKLSSNLSILFA